MKRKIETVVIFISLVLFLIIMLISSATVIKSISFSIDIWINNLFPSLFPFLIISKLFINYGLSDVISEFIKPFISNRLNINSKCNSIVVLSLFSGFPSSSVYLKDAYFKNEIDKEELEYLLSFCFFSNPLFILGTVSILLNNKKIGLFILLSQYLSNFILAIIFRRKNKIKEKINIRKSFRIMKDKIINSKPIGTVLKNIILDSINILLMLLGIISIFIVISNLLLNNIQEPMSSIVNGILEMTGGIKRITSLNLNIRLTASIIVGLISFGGISIHLQILSILNDISINYKRFVLKRILSVIISIIVLNLLLRC